MIGYYLSRKLATTIGVWLSLARAPGLGPGGRRFESCHPDDIKSHEMDFHFHLVAFLILSFFLRNSFFNESEKSIDFTNLLKYLISYISYLFHPDMSHPLI